MHFTWLPSDNLDEIYNWLEDSEKKDSMLAAVEIVQGLNLHESLAKMWKEDHDALALYGLSISRDLTLSSRKLLTKRARGVWMPPPWLTVEVTRSHQAVLKMMGRVRAMVQRVDNWDEWRLDHALPPWQRMTYEEMDRAESLMDAQGCPVVKAAYQHFDVEPSGELVWPD